MHFAYVYDSVEQFTDLYFIFQGVQTLLLEIVVRVDGSTFLYLSILTRTSSQGCKKVAPDTDLGLINMTSDQKKKCEVLIHSHAAIAATGNAFPIPGLGLATDLGTMATLAMLLAAEFGGNITESVARNLAIAALKRQVLKQPLKSVAKSASKYVPIVGPAISAGFSVAMLEAAGWSMAKELDQKFNQQ